MTTHKSFCRNCTAVCGIELEVENNKIVSLVGDRENPNSKGYYCIKGQASQDFNNGEDRLRQSQKRNPDGSYSDVANEAALDEIAARLKAILNTHGPESVALYYGTGIYYNALSSATAKNWLHSLGSKKLFSSMTVDQSAMWVTMARMGIMSTGHYTIYDTDLIVLVGTNPAVSHVGMPVSPIPPNNPMKWVREAKKRGVKLVVVDPRRTETARYADEHVAIRPGEDAAFFAGVLNLLFERGAVNEAFCERFATSVDALRTSVEPFALDFAAKRCGVPAEQIEAVATMIAGAERGCVSCCTGPAMAPFANLNWHLAEAVNVVRGFYRKAGDAIYNSGSMYLKTPPVEMVIPPNRTWEQEPKLNSTDVGLLMGEYPSALMPREIRHEGKGKLRALISVCGNPAAAIGDPEQVREAFSSLDLLVSMDLRMTETGRLADYVIATKTPYERHDMTFFDNFFPYSYAQYTRPVLEPEPDMKEDWEAMAGLSKRLDIPFVFRPPAFGIVHPREWELDLDNLPSSEELIRWSLDQSLMDTGTLMNSPSGFIREEEPPIIERAPEDDGARLDVCPPDVREELKQCFDADPVDDIYRYRLTPRRHLGTMNSAFIRQERTHKLLPNANTLYMNPEDIEAERLESGSKVQIESRYGSIQASLKADPSMRPGVVSMHHLWGALDTKDPGQNPGAHVGSLVSIDKELQLISYMPKQSAIAVTVASL